jgi:hypothetical protein
MMLTFPSNAVKGIATPHDDIHKNATCMIQIATVKRCMLNSISSLRRS